MVKNLNGILPFFQTELQRMKKTRTMMIMKMIVTLPSMEMWQFICTKCLPTNIMLIP